MFGVKNKSAMGIVLSPKEFVDDPNNRPKTAEILTPDEEKPAVETPIPSRRKKRHQEKKRRPDNFQRDASGPPKKKSKQDTKSSSQQEGKNEENISDPCHRLIPAKISSNKVVNAVLKSTKK